VHFLEQVVAVEVKLTQSVSQGLFGSNEILLQKPAKRSHISYKRRHGEEREKEKEKAKEKEEDLNCFPSKILKNKHALSRSSGGYTIKWNTIRR